LIPCPRWDIVLTIVQDNSAIAIVLFRFRQALTACSALCTHATSSVEVEFAASTVAVVAALWPGVIPTALAATVHASLATFTWSYDRHSHLATVGAGGAFERLAERRVGARGTRSWCCAGCRARLSRLGKRGLWRWLWGRGPYAGRAPSRGRVGITSYWCAIGLSGSGGRLRSRSRSCISCSCVRVRRSRSITVILSRHRLWCRPLLLWC
jgi:hypothetical protein